MKILGNNKTFLPKENVSMNKDNKKQEAENNIDKNEKLEVKKKYFLNESQLKNTVKKMIIDFYKEKINDQ